MGEIMNPPKGVKSGVAGKVHIYCPTCGTSHDSHSQMRWCSLKSEHFLPHMWYQSRFTESEIMCSLKSEHFLPHMWFQSRFTESEIRCSLKSEHFLPHMWYQSRLEDNRNQSYITVGEQTIQHMLYRSVKFVKKVCMII